MGRFADVAKAEVLTKLPWFKPGAYVVRVLNCKDVASKDKNTDFYIVELEVLRSSNPDIVVGGKYAWTQDRHKKYVGGPAVREFVAACLDVDPNDERLNDEELLEATVGGADGEGPQPFAGKVLSLICENIKTKKNTDFTKHIFQPYKEQAQDG